VRTGARRDPFVWVSDTIGGDGTPLHTVPQPT
jgi:hypothetical protein